MLIVPCLTGWRMCSSWNSLKSNRKKNGMSFANNKRNKDKKKWRHHWLLIERKRQQQILLVLWTNYRRADSIRVFYHRLGAHLWTLLWIRSPSLVNSPHSTSQGSRWTWVLAFWKLNNGYYQRREEWTTWKVWINPLSLGSRCTRPTTQRKSTTGINLWCIIRVWHNTKHPKW